MSLHKKARRIQLEASYRLKSWFMSDFVVKLEVRTGKNHWISEEPARSRTPELVNHRIFEKWKT